MEEIKEYFTGKIKEKYLVEYIFHLKIQMEHYEKFELVLQDIEDLVKTYTFERMLNEEEVDSDYDDDDRPIVKQSVIDFKNEDISHRLRNYDIYTPIDIRYDFVVGKELQRPIPIQHIVKPNENQNNYYEMNDETGLLKWKKIPKVVLESFPRHLFRMLNEMDWI